ANLRVHVGAVHVHLSAVFVDDPADVLHAFLVHPVGGRIGDHHAGKIILMLLCFRFQVGHVDITVLQRFYDHHLVTYHHGACRIGAVRGDGDEDDVAVCLAAAFMIT